MHADVRKKVPSARVKQNPCLVSIHVVSSVQKTMKSRGTLKV
jgi:hypothetical protein